ncbi:HD family phosphohydrolase [Bacillus shivajii]|uniref:HD family phosphohydrolase n=1 Tax=Bacillus shivajii TaxID=1983719 RepID=UPI001CFBD240|nr:HD family phosphohydrolase [Bacillus shivajii]UCZ54501.1 HD family phosphohydrolase [Bacillus shivajii]
MGKHSSIEHQKWWKKLKDHPYIRIFLFVILGLVTYALMFSNVSPKTLEAEVGIVSEQDIRSPITIENKQETERLQQEAYDSVEPVYSTKDRYVQNQIERIKDIFNSISQVKTEASEREEEITELEDAAENEDDEVKVEELLDSVPDEFAIEDQVLKVRESVTQQMSEELSNETLRALLQASREELELAENTITSAIHDVMSDEIHIDEVEEAKNKAARMVFISTVDPKLYRSMDEIARLGVTANYLLDERATEQERQEAVDAVDPVIVREGQLLVEEGQVITTEIYNQLALVGLLEDHTFIYPYIGLAIIVVLLISMLAYYLGDAKTTLRSNNTHLLMYVLIYSATLVILKLVSYTHLIDLGGITYAVPVAMGTMLITTLLHSRVALFTSMIFAIVASIIFNGQSAGVIDYSHGIYVFFSSVAGVFFLSKSHRVMRILQSGLFVGLVNVLVIIAILMLKNGQYTLIDAGFHIGFGVLSGFIAAVLTLGLLPFFEAGFGILSTTKLIELSSPNQPMLRKILLEAPGTYHHSVMVANLAEGACEAVGANGLLARVGAYYHDLGKTRRPHFFIENQMKMDNPHDKISPQLSKTIIISHPYDGAEMLREFKMPKEIIGIAEQHHGTTLLKYFYHKAAKESEQQVLEEEFRYPGPKAQTREAAIVGIADCVEAAVRSMNKPTPEKIENLVRKIITDRLEDGQFDECDLTLKQLNTIAQSICETLQGTFHSRIEYPEDAKTKESGHKTDNKEEKKEVKEEGEERDN